MNLLINQKEKPSKEVLQNLKKVESILKIYQKKLFNGAEIIITSGWRSWAYHKKIYDDINKENKKYGRPLVEIPKESLHLKGLAADFVVKGFSIAELFRLMDLIHFGGVERTNGNWQHIDLRGSISRFTPQGIKLSSHYDVLRHEAVFKK